MKPLTKAAQYLGSQLRQIGLFIALIVIVVFFQITTNGITLAPINVSNLVVQNSYILILAVGMVMVIIAGTSTCRSEVSSRSSARWPA
jgi:multiple monosaccharide ABC transporter membrane protein